MNKANVGTGLDFPSTRLRYSLQGLALAPEGQLGLFDNRLSPPEELALEFDEAVHHFIDFEGHCTENQRGMLRDLSRLLTRMSDDKSLWSREALLNRSEWMEVRKAARSLLDVFGWASSTDTAALKTFFG